MKTIDLLYDKNGYGQRSGTYCVGFETGFNLLISFQIKED